MEKMNIKWNYTNKIVNDLLKINRAREIVDLLEIPVSVEEEIKKSRFICHLKRISREEEGREYIAQIKKQHHKANHSCSAIIVGDDGQIKRSSDDGEPSGTAGVPMLTVLEKQGLTNVVAVVTRYFGGIKLGAGGLVRAYSESVLEAIEASEIIEVEYYDVYNITFD